VLALVLAAASAACGSDGQGDTGTTEQMLDTSVSYTLTARNSGKCVDVTNGSAANATPLQQWDCQAANPNQLFKFNPLANGSFQIVSQLSGKCLDVPGSSQVAGTVVQEYDCNGGPMPIACGVVMTA